MEFCLEVIVRRPALSAQKSAPKKRAVEREELPEKAQETKVRKKSNDEVVEGSCLFHARDLIYCVLWLYIYSQSPQYFCSP